MQSRSLAELADFVSGELIGDGSQLVSGVATIKSASHGQLTFLDSSAYRKFLPKTKATAVVLIGKFAEECPTNSIIVAHPNYAFAKIAGLFDSRPELAAEIHASAVIDESATISATARIAANCVIGANTVIAENVCIGPGTAIGEGVYIAPNTTIEANVTIHYAVSIGSNCLIHSGVVLGADGFGFAKHDGEWTKVPQLGGVELGNNVEIGSNTTIDRGALDNTVIGNDVKIDNLCQIGHNVRIGDHTAIAGCTGIAGSCNIGKHCLIGGGVGMAGHLEITDNVSIVGRSSLSGHIREPGVYSSGTTAQLHRIWRKNAARLHNLDALARRLIKLEKIVEQAQNNLTGDSDDN